MDVKIDQSWKQVLKEEFEQEYFAQIVTFLKTEKLLGKTIYPPGSLIFNAFEHTPFDKVKVVLLGQDPYHGNGQAHGLCFSVQDGVPPPPSLINIYKEIQSDTGTVMNFKNGNLTHWANQGVLLLNAALTVRANEPQSHSKCGWANFTNAVIKKVSDEKKGIIFLLWGNSAKEKVSLIDATRHFILKAAHPSPMAADRGFFGCRHFSKTNELLVQQGKEPIDWKN